MSCICAGEPGMVREGELGNGEALRTARAGAAIGSPTCMVGTCGPPTIRMGVHRRLDEILDARPLRERCLLVSVLSHLRQWESSVAAA